MNSWKYGNTPGCSSCRVAVVQKYKFEFCLLLVCLLIVIHIVFSVQCHLLGSMYIKKYGTARSANMKGLNKHPEGICQRRDILRF